MVKYFNISCFGCRDLDQYEIDLDKLFNQDLEMNYTLAFNMTSELVALEVLNRVFITLFEVRSFTYFILES